MPRAHVSPCSSDWHKWRLDLLGKVGFLRKMFRFLHFTRNLCVVLLPQIVIQAWVANMSVEGPFLAPDLEFPFWCWTVFAVQSPAKRYPCRWTANRSQNFLAFVRVLYSTSPPWSPFHPQYYQVLLPKANLPAMALLTCTDLLVLTYGLNDCVPSRFTCCNPDP